MTCTATAILIFIWLQIEIDYLCKTLAGYKGKPVPFAQHATASLANNMTKLLFNKRFDFEDPRRVRLMAALRGIGRSLSTGSIVISLPLWLYNIAVRLPFTKMYKARAAFQGLVSIIR